MKDADKMYSCEKKLNQNKGMEINCRIKKGNMKPQENNEKNQKLTDELLECALSCDDCYRECLGEADIDMMRGCIALDRDCAEICRTTAALFARQSVIADSMLKTCVEICDACAAECAKHEQDHCRKCAEACRSCAAVCREYYK